MTNKGIKTRIDEIIKDYKSSTNKPVFFLNNRKIILVVVASFAFSLGLIGYILSDQTNGFFDVMNSTIALFWGDFKDDNNILLDLAKSLAFLCVFSGVIFVFFSGKVNDWIVKNVQKKPYNLVIGLSSQNQHYIDSQKHTNTTLIIEADNSHEAVEHYRKKGFGVISSKAEETIDALYPLENLEKCIISTGNDRQNIALALKLIEKISTNKKHSIYVRVDNRDLSVLFQDHIKVIGSQTDKGIDLIPHSLQTIICRHLFKQHSVMGLQTELINSDQPFNIIVVGASKLAIEIVNHLAILAHLPHQNHLTVHLIDNEAKTFCNHIEKHFPGIAQIPQLTLATLELNSESLEFYRDPIWRSNNLTNIFIATEDDDRNLDITVNLQDTTYIQETTSTNQFHTKVLFAISSHAGLGTKIDANKETFANFYTFADISQVSSEGNLIDEDLELIAKLINHGYNNLPVDKHINEGDLHDEWMALSLHKKESNRAQAIHIDTKLTCLGLKRTEMLGQEKKERDKIFSDLLRKNRQALDQVIPERATIEPKLIDCAAADFPDIFDSLPDKLARAEHNRWNAFHYLSGWRYNEEKNEAAKQHNCLLPLEKFETDELRKLYGYDLAAVIYIPLYLAHAGYEIEAQKNEKTGEIKKELLTTITN